MNLAVMYGKEEKIMKIKKTCSLSPIRADCMSGCLVSLKIPVI